jgi:hypothetical protein
MSRNTRRLLIATAVLTIAAFQTAVTLAADAVPVTADSFPSAESDLYFSRMVKDGGFGKFFHRREPATIDNQTVIRVNRDTLYSAAVFDLDAGPVTVTLPPSDNRFMSLQVINEDQYTQEVSYDTAPHVLTKENVGTRYVLVGIRTLVDPGSPEDVAAVHKLQDAIKAEQPGGPGKFEVPQWDKASQDKIRKALLVLAATRADRGEDQDAGIEPGLRDRQQPDPETRMPA